jgi:predicted lipoprotein with Yx(FWY)xxD motif
MRHLFKLSLPAIAASLLIAACGGSSSSNTTSSAASTQPAQTGGESSSAVVTTASNAKLGTILVDGQGMTLYHLSGETNGKFICTSSACVGVWHPLTASSSGAASGEVGSLGAVRRPDGTTQVTYKGLPLYTFTSDRQPGEAKGQGIKDVGTWSVLTTSGTPTSTGGSSSTPNKGGSSSAAPSTTSAAPSSGGSSESSKESSSGGYGY